MTHSINEDAHAVLLPAFASTQLSDSVKRFLGNGGCSILLGETREEYVAREMGVQRKREENAETFIAVTRDATSLAGDVVIAVDHEITGICRLHNLVPPFPSKEELVMMSGYEFEAISTDIALAAKSLGVNCFLAPILDRVTGVNPWLSGRTWSTDPKVIASISAAYIRGLQANGIAATAKHFPGYSCLELDPAIDPEAVNIEPLNSFESSFIPFVEAINTGVEIVMTGPAIVEAFDSGNAASISSSIIKILRERLGFQGIVMSDGLDAKAILRGKPITQIAVEALHAGADHLLIGDINNQVDQIVSAIINAVESGRLAENRLNEAATKIRSLATKYGQ
jgi:beta-N-acetylhexosaminidase